MVPEKIIQQGAEAVLIRRADLVLKRRVRKGYRLKELDERIRKLRTRSEARLLEKSGEIISVPVVKKVNEREKEIDMEFIDGLKLSENLDGLKEWKEVCFLIGKNIALLHDAGIIHGDLTTSNMIWVDKSTTAGAQIGRNGKSLRPIGKQLASLADARGGKLYFIDFGLGYGNGRVEDKAVDLHLIKQALEAKHFLHWEKYWEEIKKSYEKTSKNAVEVLKRLEKVEKRGRYKQAY